MWKKNIFPFKLVLRIPWVKGFVWNTIFFLNPEMVTANFSNNQHLQDLQVWENAKLAPEFDVTV